jgi:nucleotide-binding universal stress UspA family protein
MGSHGRRRLQRWILGSVAERMMRHSPIPLLIVAAAGKGVAPTPAIRRILVTTDFSKGTPDAVDYALSVARVYRAAVTILHVVDDSAVPLGTKPSSAETGRIRDQIDALVPAVDRRNVTARVEIGKPYTTILRVIKSLRPGLVVMNTHGMGMIDRVIIGSTTERVVRGLGGICPALLIPPPGKRR